MIIIYYCAFNYALILKFSIKYASIIFFSSMRKTSRLFSTRFAILNRISLYYFSSKHTLTLKDIEEQAITSFVTM